MDQPLGVHAVPLDACVDVFHTQIQNPSKVHDCRFCDVWQEAKPDYRMVLDSMQVYYDEHAERWVYRCWWVDLDCGGEDIYRMI